MNIKLLSLLLAGALLCGCSGIELSPVNPPGVNFAGLWVIDFGDSDGTPDLRGRAMGKPSRRVRGPVNAEALRIGDGSGLAFVVQDFQVLRADRLSIEQSKDSMGIRYYPGVYRDISWGERQRGLWEVYAGWDEQTLLVISEAKDLRVVERLAISEGGQLVISVEVEADGESSAYKRVYNRRS